MPEKKYETVIGLEIHVQLKTKSKMFCRCDNYSAAAEPNTNVCEVCMGMPGSLPVTNKTAIEWAVKAALALNCEIPEFTKFDRKHYFYPDLPKGYQISQYDEPISKNGSLEIEIVENGKSYRRKVGITRVHIEEDAGKLIHPENTDYSLVDLNRAGTPLLEIVTEPDIRSSKEARIFVENLHSVMRYLEISDANMEEGNLRCDANISLRKKGDKKFGTKVEMKNMNSFKMIERALVYEEEHQKEILEMNKKVVQETKGWDDTRGKTISQRTKEEAQDYKYFPEPDIPPLNFKILGIDLEKLKKELPELPEEKAKRFEKDYGIKSYDVLILVSDKELGEYFDKIAKKVKAPIKAANWIITEVLGFLNKEKKVISDLIFTPRQLADLLIKIESGEITGTMAKTIFEKMTETGKNPKEIIEEKGIKMIDTPAIERIVEKVLKDNLKSVEDYKKGKTAALGFLVGQVMRETKGQSDPKAVNEILKKKLS